MERSKNSRFILIPARFK